MTEATTATVRLSFSSSKRQSHCSSKEKVSQGTKIVSVNGRRHRPGRSEAKSTSSATQSSSPDSLSSQESISSLTAGSDGRNWSRRLEQEREGGLNPFNCAPHRRERTPSLTSEDDRSRARKLGEDGENTKGDFADEKKQQDEAHSRRERRRSKDEPAQQDRRELSEERSAVSRGKSSTGSSKKKNHPQPQRFISPSTRNSSYSSRSSGTVVKPFPVKKVPIVGSACVAPKAVAPVVPVVVAPIQVAALKNAAAFAQTSHNPPIISVPSVVLSRLPTDPIKQPFQPQEQNHPGIRLQSEIENKYLDGYQERKRREEAEKAKRSEYDRLQKEEQRQRQQLQCAFPTRQPHSNHSRVLSVLSGGNTSTSMGSTARGMGANPQQLSHMQLPSGHTQHLHAVANAGYRQQKRSNQSRPNASVSVNMGGVPVTSNQQQQPLVPSHDTSNFQSNTDLPVESGNVPSASQSTQGPTLLFERLVSEEVQTLKAYVRTIEIQNRRLAELERIHDDLESRLEVQTQERLELEQTLEREEQMWASRFNTLEKERDQWKEAVQSERTKNERLLDLVYRKDKEIHRMIQRKYDSSKNSQLGGHGHSQREPQKPGGRGPERNVSGQNLGDRKPQAVDRNATDYGASTSAPIFPERATSSALQVQNKSPHDILNENGSVEVVRERNVTNNLLDFFGM